MLQSVSRGRVVCIGTFVVLADVKVADVKVDSTIGVRYLLGRRRHSARTPDAGPAELSLIWTHRNQSDTNELLDSTSS